MPIIIPDPAEFRVKDGFELLQECCDYFSLGLSLARKNGAPYTVKPPERYECVQYAAINLFRKKGWQADWSPEGWHFS